MADDGYGKLLRGALEQAGLSRRKFSVALAERTGNQQESEWRSLGKYLNGEEPSPERAALIAVMLGEPRLALVEGITARQRVRREALEARVAELEEALEALGPQLAEVGRRLSLLETPARPKRRPVAEGPK